MLNEWIAVAALLAAIAGGADPANDPESPRAMRSRFTSMRACYERMARQGKVVAGKVLLSLDVSDDGRVIRAEVASETLDDPTFLGCLRGHALSWRLSRSEGATQLSYAVVFQPGANNR